MTMINKIMRTIEIKKFAVIMTIIATLITIIIFFTMIIMIMTKIMTMIMIIMNTRIFNEIINCYGSKTHGENENDHDTEMIVI